MVLFICSGKLTADCGHVGQQNKILITLIHGLVIFSAGL